MISHLPKEKSKPSTQLEDFLQFWYGTEKIGKTSIAAEFPDTYFLMCEPGSKGLSIYKDDINSWKDFKQAIQLLEKSKRFKNAVVDTVDLAFKYCQDHVCLRAGLRHPGEADDYGKTWSIVRDEFWLQISRLMKLGRGVILISHTVEKEIRRRGQEAVHRTVPTLSGQARAVLEPMVDIWLHMEYNEDGQRVVRLVGDANLAAGHRLGEHHFRGLETVPMGCSPAEAYRNLVAAFNNQPIWEQEAQTTIHAVGRKRITIRRK